MNSPITTILEKIKDESIKASLINYIIELQAESKLNIEGLDNMIQKNKSLEKENEMLKFGQVSNMESHLYNVAEIEKLKEDVKKWKDLAESYYN